MGGWLCHLMVLSRLLSCKRRTDVSADSRAPHDIIYDRYRRCSSSSSRFASTPKQLPSSSKSCETSPFKFLAARRGTNGNLLFARRGESAFRETVRSGWRRKTKQSHTRHTAVPLPPLFCCRLDRGCPLSLPAAPREQTARFASVYAPLCHRSDCGCRIRGCLLNPSRE